MTEENQPKPAQINRLLHDGQSFLCLEDLLMAIQSESNFVGEQAKQYINSLCKIQIKDGGEWKNDISFGVNESLDAAKKERVIAIEKVKRNWALKDNIGWKVVQE